MSEEPRQHPGLNRTSSATVCYLDLDELKWDSANHQEPHAGPRCCTQTPTVSLVFKFFFHSFFTDAERLVIITYRCSKQHDLISCVKVIGEYTHLWFHVGVRDLSLSRMLKNKWDERTWLIYCEISLTECSRTSRLSVCRRLR